MQSPSILIIRNGAIGDTIVMSVVYQALRRHYPKAHIEVMGPVERLQIINTPGLLNGLTSFELPGFWKFFSHDAQLPKNLIEYFKQFDVILAYCFDPDGVLINNLCKTGAANVYRFDPFPPDSSAMHITTYLLRTLEVLGIYEKDIIPHIAVHESEYRIPGTSERLIGIHPGSGSAEKRWTSENFVGLFEQLLKMPDIKIALIAGPADENMIESITSKMTVSQPITLWNNLPLPLLAARLQACALYIGNDSGISHLAAALNMPTIAIFGPSNPDIWQPVGKEVVVLKGNGSSYCEGVAIHQVVTEAVRLFQKPGKANGHQV